MSYALRLWLDRPGRLAILYGTGDPATAITNTFAAGTKAYRSDGGAGTEGWYTRASDGSWALDGAGAGGGGGGGEANTGANVGTAGAGVYDSKSGVQLRFRKLNASSTRITIAADAANQKVDFDVATGTTAGTVAAGDDSRLSDARTPLAHTQAFSTITGTAAIGQLPTGQTGTTVPLGNDARFTDARTPTAHTHNADDINAGTLGIARIPVGTSGTTVAAGNDSRLSDARTPTSHDITAHTTSGGTAGFYLRQTGATSFAWGAIQAGDLPTVPLAKGGLAADLSSVAANRVLASPDGSAGGVGARALVLADLPTITPAKGGTGLTTASPANGQLLIGNGSGYSLATLTQGANVTITNSAGGITIAATAGGGAAPTYKEVTAAVTVGTTATVLADFTTALAANTKYRFEATVMYRNGTTTAVHSARVTYSGTLNATGVSAYTIRGVSSTPNTWAGTAKNHINTLNAAMPVTTSSFGNHGSTTLDAMFTIEGIIRTNAAGSLAIEVISSVAGGIVVQIGSLLRVEAAP